MPYTGIVLCPDTPRERALVAVLLACPDSRLNCQRSIFSNLFAWWQQRYGLRLKGNVSPYSITERRVPELIPVLGSQPAGDVSHKPSGTLPLLSARPAVTPATLKRLLPVSLLNEQMHDGCEQFAQECYPAASQLRFEPRPFCA